MHFSPVLGAAGCQSPEPLSFNTLQVPARAPVPAPTRGLVLGSLHSHTVETGSLSFVNPDVQKLLERLISKRAELKISKEKARKENSLENMCKSLGGEDTGSLHPFWRMGGKAEQLLSPEKSQHRETSGTL